MHNNINRTSMFVNKTDSGYKIISQEAHTEKLMSLCSITLQYEVERDSSFFMDSVFLYLCMRI